MTAPAADGAAAATAAWRAAHAGAILVDRPGLGRLSITGKDALDLLHRLSTNALKTLRPGEGAPTVFTTPKGRIIDLVTVHRLEDRLLVLTGEGRAATLVAWIDRYTFREEIRVEDRSASHGTLGIFGAGAAAVVGRVFGADAVAPPHAPVPVGAAGANAVLVRTFPLAGDGFHLVAEAAAIPALRRHLLEGAPGLREARAADLEPLRIEAGMPGGPELTGDHNPWEARLHDAISLDKGCYTGQEVIARLHTYNKVARCLVRMTIDRDAAPAAPADLTVSGEPAGRLTSAAVVPGQRRVIALGYVRDEDAVAGRTVAVSAPGEPITATVSGPAR